MIRTKQQADSHVTDTLKRIKTKQERLIRGYQFAKIYVDIKEYEKAKEYLLGFLSIKDNSAPGHKLLGQILECQGSRADAAAAYRKSLDFDPQQKDVLLKICELYSQINISPELAKVWAEKGEQAFPTNDVIFKLKMKAHTANGDGNSPEELLSFYAAESAKCPSDPIRRVKLLRSYMGLQRINEAYTQILEVEAKELFPNSLDWYRCIVDVYKDYKLATGSNTNGKFHQQLLSAMNRLTALSIEQSLTIVEAIGALWSLDQELIRQSRSISSAVDEWKALYRETEAQYVFHCGTLILNKAQKERLSWREASSLAYACFLVSHSVPVVNRKTAWYAKASADEKAVYDRWYNESCWRCSQTGHMLMQKYESSDGGQQWIDRIQDDYCHQVGRDKLFHILFTQPQQKDGKEQSYLAQSSLFTNNLLIPDRSLLMEWDRVVQQSKPDNLQVAVWTCLHYYSANDKTQPKYSFLLFERLPFGAHNLETATPETLCQLDVLAFLYATVRSAALRHTERCSRYDPYRPNLLPLPISEKLCSDGQREWWTSAYKLHTNNARESLSRLRAVLQRGLETIRLVGTNLGMDVDHVVHLARTFTEQVEEMKSQLDNVQELEVNVSFLQARAVHYWNKATELLEKLEKKRSLPTQRSPLFESNSLSLDEKQIKSYLEEGRVCKALEAKEAGRYPEAVRLFNQIKTADAAFQSALLHKELALLEQGVSQNESATHDRERPVSLLTKAKSDLYETLDRLKGDRYHILNSRVAEEIDDVETRLMRLENVHNGNSFEQEESIENLSGVERLEPAQFGTRSDAITHSTPQVQRIIVPEISYTHSETRLRPSPDRLDAQIRSLSHGQDQWLKIIMDEMKDNRTTIQKLQERVTLLESKFHDVQEQLKQSQNALLTAAAHQNLAPSAAMAPVPSAMAHSSAMVPQPGLMTPSAMMYPPSAYRAEGYDYWTSHGYDPAAALHGYRGFQQPIPSSYGVGYPGMTPRGMPPPPHYPSRSVRPETEDYGPDSFAYGDEYRRETDFAVGPEVLKEHQATGGSVSSGFTPVPALQPGFFSLPRPVPSENSLIGLTGKMENRVVRIGGASVPGQSTVSVTSEVRTVVRASESPSVITVGTKPGISSTSVKSAAAGDGSERVLPATTSLFGHSTSATAVVKPSFNQSSESQNDEDHDDSYTEPHFEPIVILPEVVDLKTGEEDETVLFADRVKLYRFTDKQWKERGVGTLKILFNESTARARILMRREQVHKVCANHYIRPDMVVEKKSPEDVKILTWKAVDCSDEEPRLEQFCCKFKAEETADQFIEGFKKAKKLITDRKQASTVDNRKSASEVASGTSVGSSASVPTQQLSAFSAAALASSSASGQTPKFPFGVPLSSSTPFSSSTFRPPSATLAAGMSTSSSQQLAKPANVTPTGSTTVVSSATSVTAFSAQSALFGSSFSATKVNTSSGQPLQVESMTSTTKVVSSSTKPPLFGSAVSSAGVTSSNTQSPLFGQTASALKVSASGTPLFSTTKVAASSTQSPFGSMLFGSTMSSTTVASAGSQPTVFGSTFSAPSFIASGAQQPVFGSFTTKVTASNGQSSLFSSTFSTANVSASTAVTSVTAAVAKFSSTSTPSIALSNAGTTTTTSVLGGFTFNKPPVVKVEEKKDVVDEKKDTSKPANPFANFSFTSGTKSVVTKDDDKDKPEKQDVAFGGISKTSQQTGSLKWPVSGQDTLNQILSESTGTEVNENDPVGTTSASSTLFGSKTSAFGLSFKTVSESTASAGFVSKKVDADIFSAKGQRLFEDGKHSEKDHETGNDEGEEEYVPNRSFEALVSLPEVEVLTGEENETKLFGARAKLYRMDNDCKQWKERGIGEMKILQHAVSQKFRILMRREQVLKVCANHYITTKMKLLPMKTSDTSWCWFARDFSEQEIHEEQLCVKFKTVEAAENFKKCFEGCQKRLAESDTPEKSAAGSKPRSANVDQTMKTSGFAAGFGLSTPATGSNEERSAEASASLSSLFKPKDGEWQCETCYVKNSGDKAKCVACETPKPGLKVDVMPLKPKIENLGPSSSASSSSLSSLFKPKDGEWQCETCYVKNNGDKAKCVACETPKPGLKVEAVKSPPNSENIDAVSSSLSSLFKPKDGEWQCDACYVKNDGSKMKCMACETPKPGAPAEQPEAKPSAQLKLGPNGGFTFGATQPMSFASGFGSSTPATDSGKKEDVAAGFMPKATGFGQVSTGFGGFAFGNTKAAETKASSDVVDSSVSVVTSGTSQPATDAVKPFSFGQAGSGFGATFAAIKTSDSKDQQPASGAGKENAKPVFGTPSTSGSKPVFTFGGAGGTASPSSFVFGGKGFSVGMSNAGNDAPQTTEKPSSASTPKKPDGSLPKPVFGSFSFASSSVSSATASQSKTTLDDSSQQVFGTPSFSFAGVNSDTGKPAESTLATPSKPAFFSAVTSPVSPQSPDGLYKNSEGEDDHIVFEPIVRLPENVEVRTGEEDEEVLYSQRAKLYRFLSGEWKERGVGDVKILQHKQTKQVRLLMRREKVLKICMNHRLAPEMSLKQMPNAQGKVLMWHAEDFADGESVHEKFSMRFKDAQVASSFETAFNRALEHLKTSKKTESRALPEAASSTSSASSSHPSGKSLLMDLLTKKGDSECAVVSVEEPSAQLVEKAQQLQLSRYFYNYLDAAPCPGCVGCDPDSFDFSTIGQRPKRINAAASRDSSASAQQHLVFGGAGAHPDFSDVAAKTPASIARQQEESKSSSASPASMKFVFGGSSNVSSFATLNAQQSTSVSTTGKAGDQMASTSQPELMFGAGQSVDFAALAASNATSGGIASGFTQSKPDPNFKWEGAGTQLFGHKEAKTNKQSEDADEDGSGAEDQEEENSGIHFTPLVQLPEVEVKTGEEDENEMFRERAKLYRFDNGQWKERGVGEMKILKNRVNGTYRLLLRREQVHKVACNHLLTTDMKLQPQRMTENAWCWFAQDFAEGEARMEQFAIRFKTSELANRFKDEFIECQNDIGRTTLKGQSASASASSTPDVKRTGPFGERTEERPSPGLAASGTSHPSYREAASNAEDEDESSTSATSQDEDDEEIALLFSKRATVKYRTNDNVFHEGGMVEIVALEDDDVAGIRLQMHRDNDEAICNHIICTGYEIKRTDQRLTCEWTAKDFSTDEPIRKTFQVTFCSNPALLEFERIFQNGVQMAVQSELSESKADEFYPRPSEDDDSNDEDYGH